MGKTIKLDLKSTGKNRGAMVVRVDKSNFGNLLSKDLKIEIPMSFDFEIPECDCCEEFEQLPFGMRCFKPLETSKTRFFDNLQDWNTSKRNRVLKPVKRKPFS